MVLIVLFAIPATAVHAVGQSCTGIFQATPLAPNEAARAIASRVGQAAAETLEAALATEDARPDAPSSPRRPRHGYAILVGTMVGSAALSTYLTSRLPSEFQFLSFFAAQVAAFGVYEIGAPIWEPMRSWARSLAFGIRDESILHRPAPNRALERQWQATQDAHSLNAQMSRNLQNQFIASVRLNFYEAYRAHRSNDPTYAAAQVAEAAYRLRILFKDISPATPSVAAAVRTAFTNHLVIDRHFVDSVTSEISRLDPDSATIEGAAYYATVLHQWLGADSERQAPAL